jgi:hypothetical protein
MEYEHLIAVQERKKEEEAAKRADVRRNWPRTVNEGIESILLVELVLGLT